MNAGACLRCQSTEAEILYRGRDYLSEDPFVVLSCQACGVARTGPGRFEQDPDRYYPTAYYGETGERFHGVLERLVARFRRARVQQIVRLVPEPGRVLDIGCGRGWMLSELHRLGWSATGVERSLQAAMADAGVRILEAPRLSDCRLEAETFEAITLWHSLEHLDQPWETLDEAARLLAPGGVLIVEVPNLASLQARWSGSQWFHLDAPRHRIHLTLDQLVADLESRGLEILSRRTFSLEYGPYGMMQSLLNRLTRRKNVLLNLLRRDRTQPFAASDVMATLLLLPLAATAGFVLEPAAAARGRGGIAHVVARKPAAARTP